MIRELPRNEFWSRVNDLAESRSLATLVGAGLSRRPPCRLPLFNELLHIVVDSLVSSLPKTSGDQWPAITVDSVAIRSSYDSIELARTKPEFFFTLVAPACAHLIPWICKIFSTDLYSPEHLAIATLMKEGLLSRVVTTNFDLCLENALDTLGLRTSEHFQVFTGPNDGTWLTDPLPCLIKVHGTASRPESIRITLEHEHRRAKMHGSFDIEGATLHVMQTTEDWNEALGRIGNRYSLLVLGQSGRDAQFDCLQKAPKLQAVFWLIYEGASTTETEFLLERLGRLSGDVFWTRGDVCHIFDLPALAATKPSAFPPNAQAAMPALQFAADEAVLAWATVCNALLPKTLQHVLLKSPHLVLPIAKQDRDISSMLGTSLRNAGQINQAIEMFEAAVPDLEGPEKLYHKSRLALTYADAGQIDRAAQVFDELLESGHSSILGDWGAKTRAWYHYHYGDFLRLAGDGDDSLRELNAALELALDIGDRFLEAMVRNSLGIVQQSTGRLQEALSCFETSVRIKHELGAVVELGNAYNNLGVICLKLGRTEAAVQWLEKSAEWKAEHGDQFGLGSAYTNLAGLYFQLRDLDRAELYASRSVQQKIAVGDRTRLPTSILALGTIKAAKGDINGALDTWLECAKAVGPVKAQEVTSQLRRNLDILGALPKPLQTKADEIRAILRVTARS